MPGPTVGRILSQAQGLSKTGLEVKAAGAPAIAKQPKAQPAEHILPVRVGGKPRQMGMPGVKWK